MARLYDEMELRFDDSENAPTIAAIVASSEGVARGGDHARAFRRLLELATGLEDAGLAVVASEVVFDLHEIVDLRRVPPEERLWLLNLEGRLAAAFERLDLAKHRFETMLKRAKRLGNQPAASTALQNLGVNALMVDDVDAALKFAHAAHRLKTDIGDEYGAAQILLNIITALLTAARDSRAAALIEELEAQIRRLRVPGLLASWYGCRAQLEVNRGNHERALQDYRTALRHARRSGELEKVMISLQNLGATNNDLGRPGRALQWYEKALRVAGALAAPARREVLLRSRAITFHRLGRDAEAREGFEKARDLAETLGNDERSLVSALDAAAVLINLGEVERALAELDELLPRLRAQSENALTLVDGLANAAVAHSLLGESRAALEFLSEALEVAAELEMPEQQLGLARRAAETALDTEGTAELAPEYFRMQLTWARALLPPSQVAWEAAEAGALLSAHGLYEQSLDFFNRALHAYSRQRNLRLAFSVRNDRALALVQMGRFGEARKDLRWCLRMAGQLQDRVLRQQAELNLGEVARRAGRHREAISRAEAAVSLAQATEDPAAEVDALGNLGLALLDAGEPEAAEGIYDQVAEFGRATRQTVLRTSGIRGMAHSAEARGELKLAAARYRDAARLDARRPEELRLALVGLLPVLVRLEDTGASERTLQRLIDLAQAEQMEADVATDLVGLTALLVGSKHHDEAADIGAAAILLAASRALDTGAEKAERNAWFEAVATVLVGLAGVFDTDSAPTEESWNSVAATLDSHEEGLSKTLAPFVETARAAVAKHLQSK